MLRVRGQQTGDLPVHEPYVVPKRGCWQVHPLLECLEATNCQPYFFYRPLECTFERKLGEWVSGSEGCENGSDAPPPDDCQNSK